MENKTPVYMLGCQPAKPRQRETDWIETYTGKRFYPFRPSPADVCIEDIAHALSLICRFTGHCSRFYSVAQHSLLVSRLVPPELALVGLLHDATEAYLQDIPRPIKKELPIYIDAEHRVHAAIAEHFGIPTDIPPEVKRVDSALLATEARQLGMRKREGWYLPEPAAEVEIRKMGPEEAELYFVERFKGLTT